MSQSLAQVYLHIIYSTKHREPFLVDDGLRREMHAYIASIFKAYESLPLIVGGTTDHVHILCTLPRTETYAKMIGKSKRNSSKWVKTKDPKLSNFMWQNGYGAFSVSHSLISKVQAYISNQEQHHQKKTFQEELREFLTKHGITFDEQYIWD